MGDDAKPLGELMELKKLEQKLAQAELQMSRLREQQRKLDAQMKIIVGSCVINQCKKDDEFLRMVQQAIDANASERDKKRLAGFSDWIKQQNTEKQEQTSDTEQAPSRTNIPF